MKLYRNAYRLPDGEHRGYTFHTSQRDAEMARKVAKRDGNTAETEQIIAKPGKRGLLSALTRYATHPDNG